MLNKFKKSKLKEIKILADLKFHNKFPPEWGKNKESFSKAISNSLDKINIIAEFKKASPSLGNINSKADLENVLVFYKEGGAIAFSILTEENYFAGKIDFLYRAALFGLPILRKDFIFHPLQVEITATTPASAVLLIVRLFEDMSDFERLYFYSLEKKLEPVVEVFSEKDLEIAKRVGAKIIQVNNRDLNSLKVDLETSYNLIKYKEDNEIWISASGLSKRSVLVDLKNIGYDAFLIGTYLMKQEKICLTLRNLVYGGNN